MTESREDRIPFALPDVGEDEALAVAETIRSGWVTSGPSMRAFESEFAELLDGNAQTVAVNSATAGLHLALEAAGVGPGDEVIVPTWTFTATAEVVRYLGAKPVIVDVEATTLNIELDSVRSAISTRTAAVVPVHMAGLPVDIPALRDAIGNSDIRIVEDAAHALPARGPAGMVGACNHSDAAVFSFYATKTITTGEGGMISTRDAHVADRCRVMRLHGIDRDAFDRYSINKPAWLYDVVAPGFKYNMPDTAAAMGRVQLARAHKMQQRRQQIADYYLARLQSLPLQLPAEAPKEQLHSWHLFVVRLLDRANLDREEFIAAMAASGVATSVHFIPLHELSYWRSFVGDPSKDLPNAVSEAPRAVSLPIYSGLTDAQVERIAATVISILS